MADYNSLKVPDLKKLLHSRSLPVSGNKAELVARLVESDGSKTNPDAGSKDDNEKEDTGVTSGAVVGEGSTAPAPTTTAMAGESVSRGPTAEENNDNKASATAEKVEETAGSDTGIGGDGDDGGGGEGVIAHPADDDRETGGTTMEEKENEMAREITGEGEEVKGGQGRAMNPVAVPNQKADFDPSKTHDLKVHRDAPASVPAATQNQQQQQQQQQQPPPATKSDFTAGLSTTNIDEEIARRKARAKRFQTQPTKEDGDSTTINNNTTENVDPTSTEAIKALERAKRFGPVNGSGPNTTGGDGEVQIRGLDQALPERTRRKRGRENNDQRGDDDDAGGDKRRRRQQQQQPQQGGGGGGRGRSQGGRGRGNNRRGGGGGGGRTGQTTTRETRRTTTTTTGKITDDPVERAKAEARAKKFGGAGGGGGGGGKGNTTTTASKS